MSTISHHWIGDIWVLDGNLIEVTRAYQSHKHGTLLLVRDIQSSCQYQVSVAHLLTGKNEVTARRNLNRREEDDVWTIHEGRLGRVLGYLPSLTMSVTDTVIREYGRQKLLAGSGKTAHAGVVGVASTVVIPPLPYEVSYDPRLPAFTVGTYRVTAGDTISFSDTGKACLT